MPTPELVREYYGQTLHSSADLKTNACCDADAVPAWLRPLLDKVHPDVKARYYGCGLVAPPLLEGCTVLDLGCGAGRDVYLLSQLVGPAGQVVGVDMTPEQLAVARAHQQHHENLCGTANVHFLEGRIEELDTLPLAPGSVDVVVSNCVLNLSTAKGAVLEGVKRLLKPGGEFYFSDVYCDRRLPDAVRAHPVLWGECLGGALYWHDFLRLARAAGFAAPRLVSDRLLHIDEPALAKLVEGARFCSATYRLFHLDGLEEAGENYGQSVVYRGSINGHPDQFSLDEQHTFATGMAQSVCQNTYLMLTQTRFSPHFEAIQAGDRHLGLFGKGNDILPIPSAFGSLAEPSCVGADQVGPAEAPSCCR